MEVEVVGVEVDAEDGWWSMEESVGRGQGTT